MLEATLDVTPGVEVTFQFSVVNAADAAVTLRFRDGCRADFAVYDADVEVWRYSDDRVFTQAVTTADLQPGETATFEATWPTPHPGEYMAEATLRIRHQEVSARTPFAVPTAPN